jgi:hypothetical protein
MAWLAAEDGGEANWVVWLLESAEIRGARVNVLVEAEEPLVSLRIRANVRPDWELCVVRQHEEVLVWRDRGRRVGRDWSGDAEKDGRTDEQERVPSHGWHTSLAGDPRHPAASSLSQLGAICDRTTCLNRK